MTSRPLTTTLALLLVAAILGPAAAQVVRSPLDNTPEPTDRPEAIDQPADPANLRWYEPSYGLSLLPPDGATALHNTLDDALVAFALPNQFRISVHLHQSDDGPITLREAARETIRQFVSAYPSATLLDDPGDTIKPAGRPAIRLAFAVSAEQGRPAWVADLVLMKLDPSHFVVFQADLEAADFSTATRQTFERVLDSVRVASLDQIDKARVELVQNAQDFVDHLDLDKLWSSLPRERWFRLVRQGRDIGFRRITHDRGNALGVPGYSMRVFSHEVTHTAVIRTKATLFLSDTREEEVWSIETIVENLDPNARTTAAPIQRYTLTGIRSGDQITVDLESPEGRDRKTWPAPPVGYLSQLETELLPTTLTESRPLRFQAYAYHAASQTLALRTEIARKLDSDAWTVATRATPTSGWRHYLFSPEGQLLQVYLADGTTLIPASADEVRRLHRPDPQAN